MKKQEERKVVQEAEPLPQPEMEPHVYADEFMNMMLDYAYEALRQHLQAVKVNPVAREMLENLIILHHIQLVYCKDRQVAYYWNQNAAETIGHISQGVMALGGRFASAPVDMIR